VGELTASDGCAPLKRLGVASGHQAMAAKHVGEQAFAHEQGLIAQYLGGFHQAALDTGSESMTKFSVDFGKVRWLVEQLLAQLLLCGCWFGRHTASLADSV